MEQIHRLHNLVKHALAAAAVRRVLKSFDRHGENDVLALLHAVAESLVNQRAVRVDHETTVRMLLCQLQDVVLAHHRLAAGHDIAAASECFAFCHDLVHILKGKIQLTAVLARPAACAVQVARRGRVKENNPRKTRLVVLAVLARLTVAREARLETEGHEQSLQIVQIHIIQKMIEELCPLSVLGERCSQTVVCFRRPCIAVELLNCIDNADICFLAVLHGLLRHHVQCDAERLSFRCMYDLIRHLSSPLVIHSFIDTAFCSLPQV